MLLLFVIFLYCYLNYSLSRIVSGSDLSPNEQSRPLGSAQDGARSKKRGKVRPAHTPLVVVSFIVVVAVAVGIVIVVAAILGLFVGVF